MIQVGVDMKVVHLKLLLLAIFVNIIFCSYVLFCIVLFFSVFVLFFVFFICLFFFLGGGGVEQRKHFGHKDSTPQTFFQPANYIHDFHV